MAQTRYGTELHTPGEYKPGPAQIIRHDPEIVAQWNTNHTRKNELKAQLAAVTGERDKFETHLGAVVAEGGDFREATDRLAELRAETEALEAGIDFLNGRLDLQKRLHHWLTTL